MHWNSNDQFLPDRFGKVEFVVVVDQKRHVVVGHVQSRAGHDVNRGEVLGIEVDREMRWRIFKTPTAI
jgi:hypothetical protein